MTVREPGHDWSIELLRGFAALMVVGAHYLPLIGWDVGVARFAFSGVDLFFVITGFLFAPSILRRPPHLAAFALRRFFRLYPLYAAAVLAYVAIKLWQGGEARYVAEHLLFLHTAQTHEIARYYNAAFWSLPPEVEFYLALPLLAMLGVRAGGFAAMTAAGVALHFWGAATDRILVMVHLPGLLVEFCIGMAAWRLLQRGSLGRAMQLGLMAAGVLLWLVLAQVQASLGDAGVGQITLLRNNMGLYAAVAFGLFLSGWVGFVLHPAEWVRTMSIGLGNLSYGVYLFHNAAPQVLAPVRAAMAPEVFGLACLGLTAVTAFALHVALEAPMRRLGRAWAARVESHERPVLAKGPSS